MKHRGVLSSIEGYFKSSDREMWKLGQLLCHKHRINYWCIFEINIPKLFNKKKPYYDLVGFVSEEPKNINTLLQITKNYKIVLDGSSKNRRLFSKSRERDVALGATDVSQVKTTIFRDNSSKKES